MAKIKVSADMVLAILKGIMEDPAINYKIEDVSAPDWLNKTVQEALNVEYYTFRHRPADTEVVIGELIKQGLPSNELQALTRSFCILSLGHINRVFSKNTDTVIVPVNLEYWVQTEKVKLLEDMFEDISVETIGERVPVQIGKEERQMVVALGSLNISELQETSEYGEMTVCDIDIDLIFHPNVSTMSDYKVEFLVGEEWVKVPVSSVSISNNMNQKPLPKANNTGSVGQLNLSKVKSFVFTFDGFKNKFIDRIVDYSLSSDSEQYDNNEAICLKITRNNKIHSYICVLKDHIIKTQEDTGHEVHSLTLTIRGKGDGTTQS
ncbi:MAG: hypothetical protein IJX17_00150 [Clostridia bacterium]|nr:hypothetical protein [Clostridia bacterium]